MEVEVSDCSYYNDKMILKFTSFDCFDDTSIFLKKSIFIKRKHLPEPSDGEYYWTDIYAMKVYSFDNVFLGSVDDIIETGSNDILVIKKEEEELLIPMIKDVIREIDYDNDRIVVEHFED